MNAKYGKNERHLTLQHYRGRCHYVALDVIAYNEHLTQIPLDLIVTRLFNKPIIPDLHR